MSPEGGSDKGILSSTALSANVESGTYGIATNATSPGPYMLSACIGRRKGYNIGFQKRKNRKD